MTVHWFKGLYALAALVTVFVDLAQIGYSADGALRLRPPAEPYHALAIISQYALGSLNVWALAYFFRG